jgi:hypothetical protein
MNHASCAITPMDPKMVQVDDAVGLPNATAMQGDALELIQKLPCDVLLSNLPTEVTECILPILPRLSFRVAVLAVGEVTVCRSNTRLGVSPALLPT